MKYVIWNMYVIHIKYKMDKKLTSNHKKKRF
jgi:hypothetical protein